MTNQSSSGHALVARMIKSNVAASYYSWSVYDEKGCIQMHLIQYGRLRFRRFRKLNLRCARQNYMITLIHVYKPFAQYKQTCYQISMGRSRGVQRVRTPSFFTSDKFEGMKYRNFHCQIFSAWCPAPQRGQLIVYFLNIFILHPLLIFPFKI